MKSYSHKLSFELLKCDSFVIVAFGSAIVPNQKSHRERLEAEREQSGDCDVLIIDCLLV